MFTPETGEIVLSTKAQTIWASSEKRLSLEQLLDRVQPQERSMVASALRDSNRLCGLDLQFWIISRAGSRLIWIYFSKSSSSHRSYRAWCVDLTSHR